MTTRRTGIAAFSAIAPGLRRARGLVLAASLAAAGSQLIGIPLALAVRRLVSSSEAWARDLGLSPIGFVVATGAVFAGLVAGRSGLRWLQVVWQERAAQTVIVDARSRMYAHLHTQPLGWFERRPIGKLLVRFVGDSNALRAWVQRVLVRAPADLLTVVAVLVTLGIVDVRLLAAAAVPLAALVPLLVLLNPRIRTWTRAGRSRQTDLTGLIADRIPHFGAARAHGLVRADVDEAVQGIESIADANVARSRFDAWSQALAIGAGTASLCGVALAGLWLELSGGVDLGDLLVAVWLTFIVRGPVTRLAGANAIHQRAVVSAERIARLLDRAPEPGAGPELPELVVASPRLDLRGLGYRERTGDWAFRGLDARLRGPGLVRVDGPARSVRTLEDLLLRLRRPHEGRIRIDRQDLRRVRVDSVRRAVGVVRAGDGVAELVAGLSCAPMRAAWDATEAISPTAELPPTGPTLAGDPAGRLRLAAALAIAGDPVILVAPPPDERVPAEARAAYRAFLDRESGGRLVLLAGWDPPATGDLDDLADVVLTLAPAPMSDDDVLVASTTEIES